MPTLRLLLAMATLAVAATTAAPAAAPAEEAAALTLVQPTRQPLPDTSNITGELIERLGVSKFFSLWLVFNDPTETDIKTGVDYVILAPKEPAPLQKEADPQDRPAIVKKLLLDHVILGQKLNLAGREDKKPFTLSTLGGRDVEFSFKQDQWFANEALIVGSPAEIPAHGELVVLNKYAFADYDPSAVPKEGSEAASSPAPAVLSSSSSSQPAAEPTTAAPEEAFLGDLADELSKITEVFNLTRVPIFNKFLPDAKVSELLKPGEQYTVLFPMDRAFQKWHPIDWGFYPFSVPEFTSEIVRSHFVHGTLRLDQITDGFQTKTLTNRTLTFKKLPSGDVIVNGVPVMRREVALQKGTVLVIPDVLFVNHQVVQELRAKNMDKETPPLIAFPWWNAQFLSHAFLSLDKNGTFPSIERLLNMVPNLHLRVPGKDYTFLVPTEDAFQKAGLSIPSWWSSEKHQSDVLSPKKMETIEDFLLRHLIHRRFYMRELVPELQMQALDSTTYIVEHKDSKIFLKTSGVESQIVQGDNFVYNLGTILFVDTVLSDNVEALRALTLEPAPTETTEPAKEVEDMTELLSPVYIEEVSSEALTGAKDVLVDEASAEQTTTTQAAPVTDEASTESNAIPQLPSEP
ncbi:Hypothetical predicted protein [Cloeon dipterum]|uniref:FAS1 domain-containing protein n=1 Tax=Cloeon dipterum TaxID=197152 RepID=A0A8S1CG92_9INSE|nr:Hypothetical predicted protein [Cloeon dipterum]